MAKNMPDGIAWDLHANCWCRIDRNEQIGILSAAYVSDESYPNSIPLVADLKRQLAHQQGVIEALQANIAELTKPPPEVSLTPLVGDRRAVLTIGLYESKPAIPAQALKAAKLPKFF